MTKRITCSRPSFERTHQPPQQPTRTSVCWPLRFSLFLALRLGPPQILSVPVGLLGKAAYSAAVRSQRAKIWIGNVIATQNLHEGSVVIPVPSRCDKWL